MKMGRHHAWAAAPGHRRSPAKLRNTALLYRLWSPAPSDGRPIDKRDQALLAALLADARASVQSLQVASGLRAAKSCHDRIRRLHSRGAIRGYSAIVDERALGFAVTVFVSLDVECSRGFEARRLQNFIAQSVPILDCWLVAGAPELLLRVGAGTVQELTTFLVEELAALSCVRGMRSTMIMQQVKRSGGVQMLTGMDERLSRIAFLSRARDGNGG